MYMKNYTKREYDIGILTFWGVPNYGTFAQAYALQSVIQKIDPSRSVHLIAYLNKKHYQGYYSIIPFLKRPSINSLYEIFKRIIPTSNFVKKRRMFASAYNSINHTKELSLKQLLKTDFNVLILGSDIIWDYSFDLFGNDHSLFGLGIRSKIKCSYAASFGTINTNMLVPDYVVKGLHGLNLISVRDEKSANIVNSITRNKPEIVLDPTWLWDFDKDQRIIKPKHSNYLVVYGQDFDEMFISQIINFATKSNLLIICLDCNNDNYKWCDLLIKQHQLSPFEWLGYFMYSEAVITSTFHGITFALIFRKKIAFCKTEFIINKISSFLTSLDLFDLLCSESSTVNTMLSHKWDYDRVYSIIQNERKKSIDYLKKIIQRDTTNGT